MADERASKVILAALTRPLALVAPGAGLLFALAGGLWWLFPLSLVPYAALAWMSTRDPKFVARTLGITEAAAVPSLPKRSVEEVVSPSLRELLQRIDQAETKIRMQVDGAGPAVRSMLEASLQQVQTAQRTGVDLAIRAQDIERQMAAVASPAAAREKAQVRRDWAAKAPNDATREEYLSAAAALDDLAGSADALGELHQRLLAQLDSLAASLESAAARSMRIRVGAADDEGGAEALSEALRVDVELVRETLATFEEVTVPAAEPLPERRSR